MAISQICTCPDATAETQLTWTKLLWPVTRAGKGNINLTFKMGSNQTKYWIAKDGLVNYVSVNNQQVLLAKTRFFQDMAN
jgi:hypothetical protein